MSEPYPQLVVDEGFFLAAVKFLASQEERHELLNVVRGFTREPHLAARFARDVDREIASKEREAIADYVAPYISSVTIARPSKTSETSVTLSTGPRSTSFAWPRGHS